MRQFLLLVAFLIPIFAHSQTFGLAVRGGLTASQIDGDFSKGFQKAGIVGGLESRLFFSEKTFATLGFQFVQRGSKRRTESVSLSNNFNLTLNAIEVPLTFHVQANEVALSKKKRFFRNDFYAGVSYARVLGSSLKNGVNTIDRVTPLLNSNEFLGLLGFGYNLNKHWGVAIEFRRSLSRLYDFEKVENPPIEKHWYSRVLLFQTVYAF